MILNARIDVSIERVKLEIRDVHAEAYLRVRLDNVRRVVEEVRQTNTQRFDGAWAQGRSDTTIGDELSRCPSTLSLIPTVLPLRMPFMQALHLLRDRPEILTTLLAST